MALDVLRFSLGRGVATAMTPPPRSAGRSTAPSLVSEWISGRRRPIWQRPGLLCRVHRLRCRPLEQVCISLALASHSLMPCAPGGLAISQCSSDLRRMLPLDAVTEQFVARLTTQGTQGRDARVIVSDPVRPNAERHSSAVRIQLR